MKLFARLATPALAVLLLGVTGCATLFSANNQKVKFVSTTPGATIRYNDDSIGIGVAKQKLSKNHVFQTVSVEKKGYQTRNYPLQVEHLGGTAAFAIIDLGGTLLAPFFILADLSTPKVHRYKKTHKIPALVPLENRQPDEKYLLVNNTAFNAKSQDVRYSTYRGLKAYNRKQSSAGLKGNKKSKQGKDGIDVTNTIFTDVLNDKLMDMGFIDTNRKLFTNASNTLYLDATIKKVSVHQIARNRSNFQMAVANRLLSIQMEIEWKVLDYYKQPVYTVHTEKTSDLFTVSFRNHYTGDYGSNENSDVYGFSPAIKKAIANNFEQSLAVVRSEISKKGMLTIAKGQADTSAFITLPMPQVAGDSVRLNEMLKSSVSIKVDDGHGSGVIVSEDGYIVTNYHVVAGSKELKVIFNNDSTAMATVIKVNPDADLALIKVKMSGLKPLPLTTRKDQEIGIDVWAIGTPRSLELGQSLSRGIVSGVRNANDLSYIQTDVKISPGNSGGALINRKGEVLGIISSKLIGFGTEGVGFAISAPLVLEKLKIKYQ